MRKCLISGFILIVLLVRVDAFAEPAGRVIAEHDGRQIEFPLLQSRYSVNIEGDMATIEVIQTFENSSAVPLHAQYLFPLNQHAAVYGMEMHLGNETIQAVIKEKHQAQAVFETAKDEGKAAALLTQHRPNMFTQDIANMMPSMPVEVRLRYVQMVPKVEGEYELVIPLIVGPRYEGAPKTVHAASSFYEEEETSPGTWQIAPLPVYPEVVGLNLPGENEQGRVSLDLTMTPGLPLSSFGSPTHSLQIDENETGLKAQFAQGKVVDNRDLILRYGFEGESVEAVALSHQSGQGDFVSVMIEPPKMADEALVTPRELVFVLDTSGSMRGEPMDASKSFMMAALDGMRPEDYFRIIPFSSTARHMSKNSLRASPENVRSAKSYIRSLTGDGGTEIDTAIRSAFATSQPKGTMRIVVFLSDGYIGNEAEVLQTISKQIGQSRIYAFGVGSAVNRYLLDGMAGEGRGYARYVGLDENALDVAQTLARDLKSPLLTDIEIDWQGLAVKDVSPSRIPDLFDGGSLRIYARHEGAGPSQVLIKGLVNGHPAKITVPVKPTDKSEEPAIPLIWARNRIDDLERNVALGKNEAASDYEITRLGLAFSLQTKNTSFVAVSEKVYADSSVNAEKSSVPLPMVHGIQASAYPQNFAGSSAPEPRMWLGMMVLAGLSLFWVRRRISLEKALC